MLNKQAPNQSQRSFYGPQAQQALFQSPFKKDLAQASHKLI